MFPGSPIHQNRLYQHLMLTQKFILYQRIDYNRSEEQSSYKQFLRSYVDILPREDLSQLIFWPKHILTEIDSQLLI